MNSVRADAEAMQHPLRPAPAPVGRQLEHCPAVGSAAVLGRAVEIAGGIEDQPGGGISPVRAVAVEVMQHLLRPGSARRGRQLEHRPGAVSAARDSRTVEIASSIEDQASLGITPVRTIAETMQHLLRPSSARYGHQLEHRPGAVSAAYAGGAVEIAGGIENQASPG